MRSIVCELWNRVKYRQYNIHCNDKNFIGTTKSNKHSYNLFKRLSWDLLPAFFCRQECSIASTLTNRCWRRAVGKHYKHVVFNISIQCYRQVSFKEKCTNTVHLFNYCFQFLIQRFIRSYITRMEYCAKTTTAILLTTTLKWNKETKHF